MKIAGFLLFLLINVVCIGQTIPAIDSLITSVVDSNKVVSLAVAIIDSGKVVHINATGLRDLQRNLKTSIHTPYHIASVSKTVTNMAVFKLVEEGKIDLNADINLYLPFKVTNPFYPEDKITVRDLLNHHSGIKDDYEIYAPHWNVPKGDPTIPLKEFLYDYLNTEGKLYDKEHFQKDSTYSEFAYSNTGVAVLGLIVEHVSRMSYEDFCQLNIFKPMEMNETSWFLKHLDSSLVAKTYVSNYEKGFKFMGHNGYPDYPGGQLRTSIDDYASLVTAYLNAENGAFILMKKTTKLITPAPKISHEGFFTWFLEPINSHLYYTHGGGDSGVSTVVLIDVLNKNAIIIFANSRYRFNRLLATIENEMWSK